MVLLAHFSSERALDCVCINPWASFYVTKLVT